MVGVGGYRLADITPSPNTHQHMVIHHIASHQFSCVAVVSVIHEYVELSVLLTI